MTKSVHYLNPSALALLKLLDSPRTLQDVMSVFASAFPETPPARLAEDLSHLMIELERLALIRDAGTS
ncbi:MAG: PqqD family peptide modification chaperone [Pseudomonadota bacterium]